MDSIRPSKHLLYQHLARDLRNISCGVGLDAASADMKNRAMFHTATYVGIDFDLNALKRGLLRYDADAIALHADLTTFELPPFSVDVCVSTNTFEHLDTAGQMAALTLMVAALKSNGVLLLSKHRDADLPPMIAYLRAHFESIEIVYYRNFLSAKFEQTCLHADVSGRRYGWCVRAAARLLSVIERATQRFPQLNLASYIRCFGKLEAGPAQEFSVPNATRLAPNLFSQIANG